MKKILFLLPLFFLCGCQSDAPAAPKTGMVAVYPVGTRTLNYTIVQGQLVKFRLEANPTTGFRWDLDESGESCPVQLVFIAPRPNGMTGVPGLTEIVAEPKICGLHQFKLRYCRPWEKGVAPAAEVTVKIKVIPQSR